MVSSVAAQVRNKADSVMIRTLYDEVLQSEEMGANLRYLTAHIGARMTGSEQTKEDLCCCERPCSKCKYRDQYRCGQIAIAIFHGMYTDEKRTKVNGFLYSMSAGSRYYLSVRFYPRFLYTLIARPHVRSVIPTHHARATHISMPAG